MTAASGTRFLTTLWFPLRPCWTQRADIVPQDERPSLRHVWRTVRRGLVHDVVLLNGSGREDQLSALLLRRLRPRTRVILTDCTWQPPTGRARRAAERLLVRALDGPATTYCVLSQAEADAFPVSWGVDASRVRVTHWYVGLGEADLRRCAEPDGPGAEGVFAGGDSMRDYRPLLEAARSLDVVVRVAARQAPPVPPPPNVVFHAVEQDEYLRRMRRARIVVVALRGGTERSAGQNNYLNPMALGKLVVVTDATGVREYVEDGVTGLVVPPDDAAALMAALQWALDPANASACRRICDQAQRVALERFGPQGYVERLLEVVDT